MTTATGTLASSGVGSGLDVSGIVSKLMSIERQPITRLDTQTGVVTAEITAYGTLKGTLSTLQTAVQTLATQSTYSATKTTVADTTQFNATSDGTAAVGNYSIQVQQLAKQQKLTSTAFAKPTDSVGTGTLTFDFGSYNTDANGVTTFAPNTNKKTVTVTIPSGSDSLSAIASAINASKAGVSATVLNDGTSSYLSFSPSDPGSANALKITVNDNDGNNSDAAGLSRLAFDQSSGMTQGSLDYTSASVAVAAASNNNQFTIALDGGTATTVTLADGTYNKTNIVTAMQTAVDSALGAGKAKVSLDANNKLIVSSATTTGYVGVTIGGVPGNTGTTALFGDSGTAVSAINRMTQTVAPQDARLLVDGVQVVKSTNTITDAIQGVTLSLAKEGTAATTVSVAADSSSLSKALDTFVTTYNKVSSSLADLLAYDPATGKAGALQSEGTVRSIQSSLRQMIQTVGHSVGISSMSDLGVSFQRDGTLKFSSDKLNTALSDPTKNIQAFFIGKDGSSGLANKMDSLMTSFVGSSGSIATRTSGLNQTLTYISKQRAALEVRMTDIETRYTKQYNALDSLIANMKSTSTYLTQQLSSLTSSSNK